MYCDADSDARHVVNRFTFLSKNKFKIINEEGFEKILKIYGKKPNSY
jgi:hypothetical protein